VIKNVGAVFRQYTRLGAAKTVQGQDQKEYAARECHTPFRQLQPHPPPAAPSPPRAPSRAS
jgi:hypothetical protein